MRKCHETRGDQSPTERLRNHTDEYPIISRLDTARSISSVSLSRSRFNCCSLPGGNIQTKENTYKCTRKHIKEHTHTRPRNHESTNAQTHKSTHGNTYEYAHTCTYTYTCMHTQKHKAGNKESKQKKMEDRERHKTCNSTVPFPSKLRTRSREERGGDKNCDTPQFHNVDLFLHARDVLPTNIRVQCLCCFLAQLNFLFPQHDLLPAVWQQGVAVNYTTPQQENGTP